MIFEIAVPDSVIRKSAYKHGKVKIVNGMDNGYNVTYPDARDEGDLLGDLARRTATLLHLDDASQACVVLLDNFTASNCRDEADGIASLDLEPLPNLGDCELGNGGRINGTCNGVVESHDGCNVAVCVRKVE